MQLQRCVERRSYAQRGWGRGWGQGSVGCSSVCGGRCARWRVLTPRSCANAGAGASRRNRRGDTPPDARSPARAISVTASDGAGQIPQGREEQAQQLLADPASAAWCTAQGVDGDTALHLACLYGRAQLVPLLISKVSACPRAGCGCVGGRAGPFRARCVEWERRCMCIRAPRAIVRIVGNVSAGAGSFGECDRHEWLNAAP